MAETKVRTKTDVIEATIFSVACEVFVILFGAFEGKTWLIVFGFACLVFVLFVQLPRYRRASANPESEKAGK